MRDGVVLRADVSRPSAEGRFPTLVYRTPYDRKRASEDEVAKAALAAGYAVVRVDVRGRYESEGDFTPYRNEGRDGYDTIEWAAAQPWSTGEIGTYGLSYPGAVQWLAAVESPPHLKAMVPAMTFSTPRNFFYAGGAWDLSWLSWIWNNIAPDTRVKKNLPGPRTGREARAAWKELEKTPAVSASADRGAGVAGTRALLLRVAGASAGGCLVGMGGSARASTRRWAPQSSTSRAGTTRPMAPRAR